MKRPGNLIDAIPEFRTAGKSVRIAPNTTVPLTARLIKIIDSHAFQRLRKIRQLSLSDRVYPSATHTRFSHALGVYNTILCYLRHLDSYPEFHEVYDEQDYLSILLAGLLHDLGHYPCSHQLDHLPQFPAHEELTVAIIEGTMAIEGENLGDLIRAEFDLDPRKITALLREESEQLPPHLRLLKQLIDSPLDADKCDYLPRDSYFCGVEFASGFDMQRFIENLVPINGRLGIHEKGLMGAERFQLARYWMYRGVYWAHTVRALITMLSSACLFLEKGVSEDKWTDRLVKFNDHNFLDWLHVHLDEPGRELIGMVHHGRQPYKRLLTTPYHHQPEDYMKLQESPALRNQIMAELRAWSAKKGLELSPHHLLWDVPPIYKTENWETFPVLLSNGTVSEVARESPVVDALAKAFLQGVRKIRLFCHPKFAALVAAYPEEAPDIKAMVKRG